MMRQISIHNEDKVTSGILDTVYVGSPYDRKLLNSDATQSGKYVRCTVHTHTHKSDGYFHHQPQFNTFIA